MKDLTIASYDKMAHGWAESHWFGRYRGSGKLIFARLLKGNYILDAGCGPGRFTEYFLSKGYKVLGIDKSEGMLNEARIRVPKGDFKNMDLLRLNLPRNKFDGIWCCAALLHIKKKEAGRALRGFRRVLKENGILYVSLKEGIGERIEKENGTKRFFSYYKRGEAQRLIDKYFSVLKIYQVKGHGSNWVNVIAINNKI